MANSDIMRKIIFNPDYNKYNLGENHPFNFIRVEMMLDLLNEWNLLTEFESSQSVSTEKLEVVHDRFYINAVEKVSNGELVDNIEKYGLGTLDNPIVNGMAKGARIQAGGTLHGAQLLIEKKAEKVLQLGGGFHHARRALAEGFCLYNDLALAIKEMTSAGWHVVYLDLDVHHGDGVQEIFYSDDKVMTISLHESGEYLFPGTGWIHELGKSMGRSLKLNLPLEPFTEGESYFEVLNGILEPALRWFRPDAIVVQAGADAHFSDPLADLNLKTQDFANIYKRVLDLSDQFCNGRTLFTLGGGYSLTAAPRIWVILYLIFLELEIPQKIPQNFIKRWENKISHEIPSQIYDPDNSYAPIPRRENIKKQNRELITRLLDAVAPYWI